MTNELKLPFEAEKARSEIFLMFLKAPKLGHGKRPLSLLFSTLCRAVERRTGRDRKAVAAHLAAAGADEASAQTMAKLLSEAFTARDAIAPLLKNWAVPEDEKLRRHFDRVRHPVASDDWGDTVALFEGLANVLEFFPDRTYDEATLAAMAHWLTAYASDEPDFAAVFQMLNE